MSTVLLTGAGGAATPTLIEHLQGLGYRVIACDMDKHAAGLYFADKGYIIPAGDSPDWTIVVRDVCEREGVDVVIPLVDEELVKAHDLMSVKVIAPRREFVETCLDKWECMKVLGDSGVMCPDTKLVWQALRRDEALPFPVVLKPRVGHGSNGVEVFTERWKFESWRSEMRAYRRIVRMDTNLVQEYIDGPEYTVSVVCDSTNIVHAVVPKEVIDKRGITRIAVSRKHERIDAVCRRIAAELQPCGPFNVQLRLRGGEPYVFEINPRFSTSVTLTMAAGCDEVGGLVALALGKPYAWGEWREGVVLVRRTQDVTMDEAEFVGREPVES